MNTKPSTEHFSRSMINKISIVDDDHQIASLLESIATNIGFTATVFKDAKQFIDINHSNDEIILLDLSMPGVDGIEVMRALARQKCRSIIILMSGYADTILHSAKELACALNLRCIAGLSKPIQIESLSTLLLRLSGSEVVKKDPDQSTNEYWAPSKVELVKAIKEEQLEVMYQAKMNLQMSTLAGAEALVRWHHPDKGLLLPNSFIPLFEYHNLMDELTFYVIKKALNHAQQINCAEILPSLSVNISSSNINKLSLPEVITEAFGSGPLPPTKIYLELTESELMDELVTSLDILTRLRLRGFNLSIDDFGTGYSSLAKLHQGPFSELKIDKSFVINMKTDKEAYAIVETCIMLAHKLNMLVTAEGVEDKATVDLLTFLKCDFIQGFYISEALPFKEFIALANATAKNYPSLGLIHTPDLFRSSLN